MFSMPFDSLKRYPSRRFKTITGETVDVPILGDLTVNEEIVGVELQSRWESGDFTDPAQAILYRIEAVALFLSSRSGREWTLEEVKSLFTSRETKRIFEMWQEEIEASLAGQPEGSGDVGESPPVNTGSESTGACSTTTPETPVLPLTVLADAQSD